MERKKFQAVCVNPGYTSKNGNWTVVYRVENATEEEVAKFKAFKGALASKCIDLVDINGTLVECPLVWVDLHMGNRITCYQTTKGNIAFDDSEMKNASALAKKYPMLQNAIAQQAMAHINLFGGAKSVNITPVNQESEANLGGF
jgi:hypothetical protein